MKPINVSEYEELARTRMEASAWDYYQGGSDDEVTLRANREIFARFQLRPRLLSEEHEPDLHTVVMGSAIDFPILVAPSAFHGLAHADAECATALGASAAGTIMTASTFSTCSLEEIAQATTGPLWFQLYAYRDLATMQSLLQRVEHAGYQAIVLTVDTSRLSRRERDIRNAFVMPEHARTRNFAQTEAYLPEPAIVTWKLVEWLLSYTRLPVLLKGILTAEDARIAVEHGVKGIVVSNHGGRQLDGVVPALAAVPEVVDAVQGRCEVYMDGGIRRGTDVVKALALGAKAVFIGRPALWGLAADGAEGVQRVLELLRDELWLAMLLAGCPDLAKLDRSFVREV
jgi:isopentenyl diphosphate isomerase/L-lactate dehydrogenase-like FMN-dependent dehydrogenase